MQQLNIPLSTSTPRENHEINPDADNLASTSSISLDSFVLTFPGDTSEKSNEKTISKLDSGVCTYTETVPSGFTEETTPCNDTLTATMSTHAFSDDDPDRTLLQVNPDNNVQATAEQKASFSIKQDIQPESEGLDPLQDNNNVESLQDKLPCSTDQKSPPQSPSAVSDNTGHLMDEYVHQLTQQEGDELKGMEASQPGAEGDHSTSGKEATASTQLTDKSRVTSDIPASSLPVHSSSTKDEDGIIDAIKEGQLTGVSSNTTTETEVPMVTRTHQTGLSTMQLGNEEIRPGMQGEAENNTVDLQREGLTVKDSLNLMQAPLQQVEHDEEVQPGYKNGQSGNNLVDLSREGYALHDPLALRQIPAHQRSSVTMESSSLNQPPSRSHYSARHGQIQAEDVIPSRLITDPADNNLSTVSFPDSSVPTQVIIFSTVVTPI